MTPRAADGPLHPMEFDLGQDEARRQAAVVAALGDTWDPAARLAEEDEAHRLLYSGLDAEQAAVYRRLVEAGVLPPREDTGRASD